jgi:hypothetical protein
MLIGSAMPTAIIDLLCRKDSLDKRLSMLLHHLSDAIAFDDICPNPYNTLRYIPNRQSCA